MGCIHIRQDDPDIWLVEIDDSLGDEFSADPFTHPSSEKFPFRLHLILGKLEVLSRRIRESLSFAVYVAKGDIVVGSEEVEALCI